MHRVADIVCVAISLEVQSKQALFVLLGSDGSINRAGSGSVANTDSDFFIGVTPEPLLPALLTYLSDDMLKYTGGYNIPEQRGAPCRLSIAFKFSDGANDGFGFSYGGESQGPPIEIARFVSAAVSLTDPWHSKQIAMVRGTTAGASKKPWWKFW